MLSNRPKLKIAIYVVAGLLIIAAIALGTATLLSKLAIKDDNNPTQNTTERQLLEAKKNQEEADTYKTAGKTEQAIESYDKALDNYKAAGDEGSASAIELELRYLKSLSGPNARNVSNDKMPSEDPATYSPDELEDDEVRQQTDQSE